MKIVADNNIPYVDHYFGGYGDLILKPGRSLTYHDVQAADMVLVRSVTRVDQTLLRHHKPLFLGSAATGTDHLDIEFLNREHIPWAAAYGCNATAVVEYVMSVIAVLQHEKKLPQKNFRAGVIGVGRIGNQVVQKLRDLGCDVLQCDPPRALQEQNFFSTPLEQFQDLDFITLHVTLAPDTHHLIDKPFLQRQKKNTVILNTSRGSVIHFDAVKRYGQELLWCLDVWEQEPNIDLDVMQQAFVATPHIAGYSVQSKLRATKMLYTAARAHQVLPGAEVADIPYPEKKLISDHPSDDWQETLLKIYDPRVTTEQMKQALLTQTATFDQLRQSFPDRHELAFCIK